VGFDELDVDSEAAEADVELRIGAAIQRAGGYQLIARAKQAGDGQELRRLSAGSCEATDAGFERGHALLKNVGGGVHDAAVNVAELLQREKIGGVSGILEDEN